MRGCFIAANYGWTVVCIVLAIALARTATIFGLGHVVLEGAFVATLARGEWRRRDVLTRRRSG